MNDPYYTAMRGTNQAVLRHGRDERDSVMTRRLWAVVLMLAFTMAACSATPADQTPALTPDQSPDATNQTVVMATNTLAPEDTAPSPTPENIEPTASYTPFIYPLTLEPEQVCAGAPASRLILFERARVGEDDPQALNLRGEPGLSGKAIDQLPVGSVFMVLEGPVCQDNYAWFRVQSALGEGWVAEGDARVYFTEPFVLP
jgi:hypothetical protein